MHCSNLQANTSVEIQRFKSLLHYFITIAMVGEMVQNSQSLYSFTFCDVIIIHEYIDSHSATKFIFRKYINPHLKTYFLFTNMFTHIYAGIFYSHSATTFIFRKYINPHLKTYFLFTYIYSHLRRDLRIFIHIQLLDGFTFTD